MSNNIIHLNEGAIKLELKELVVSAKLRSPQADGIA